MWQYPLYYIVFFFFQAEDGIRDGHVTGVQTCALPIACQVRSRASRSTNCDVTSWPEIDCPSTEPRPRRSFMARSKAEAGTRIVSSPDLALIPCIDESST